MAASARTVLISAVSSGQGKTTVTAALARKFVRGGRRVRVFKTGPDFLDPMMLERASGSPVHVLDLWMVGEERCRALLAQAATEADVILIEGVMGLYDGTPSSADLARAFGVPVLAVLDASAMAQTAGAVALGLRDYGPVRLAGVIANRIASERHAQMVAEAMRDIPLFGTLLRQDASLPERHLGLVQPGEVAELDTLLDALADALVLDPGAWEALEPVVFTAASAAAPADRPLNGRTVAIARDAAFAFLYPANIDCLRDLGATVVYFSPLADEGVPAGSDAVYLPGGYPELHAARLAHADHWKSSMRETHVAGVPILAECGGMMALAEHLVDTGGHRWPMAGLLNGTVVMQKRLAAIGGQGWDTAYGCLRGHAFHYSRFETDEAEYARTRRHPAGGDGEAIYRKGSLTASYFHSYFPSCPQAVATLLGGGSP
ncbi:MAG TPA: cobyrinate a,c-diamide synthase [Noviherbaspirillum sp.]|nr:cobyrinate a,c-diamide synthase [Noviherbaspirillum sp.]